MWNESFDKKMSDRKWPKIQPKSQIDNFGASFRTEDLTVHSIQNSLYKKSL